MSSTINASSAGIVETADASGTLQLQTGGQSALYIDTSQNITIPKNLTVQGTLTFSGGGGGAVTTVSGGSTGLTPSTPASGNVVLGGTLLYSSGGTGLTSTGSSGNLLVSTGSGWASQSPTSAGIPSLNASNQTWTQPNNFLGVTNGSSASAGYIGEVITANASNISLTSATIATVTSVTLTAGVWLINATAGFSQPSGSSAVATAFVVGVNTTTSMPSGPDGVFMSATMSAIALPYNAYYNFSSTQTVYLLVDSVFSGGAAVANGSITAIRIR